MYVKSPRAVKSLGVVWIPIVALIFRLLPGRPPPYLQSAQTMLMSSQLGHRFVVMSV